MLALVFEDIAYHAAVAIDKVMYLVQFEFYRFSGFELHPIC